MNRKEGNARSNQRRKRTKTGENTEREENVRVQIRRVVVEYSIA